MAYKAFILLPTDTEVSIEDVRRILEDYYSDDAGEVTFETEGSKLTVTIDEWECFINRNSQPSVLEESKDMAKIFASKRLDKDEIAASGVRLEILTEDDNEEMEFFNDYVEIVEQLGNFRGAKIWEGGQEAFLD